MRVFSIKDTTDTEEDSLRTATAAQMKLQPKKFMQKNDNMEKSYPLVISCRQAEHNKAQEGEARYLKPSMT